MANIPGYPGYNSWSQPEADADFRDTGGVGKEDRSGGGSNGGGGVVDTRISAPDLAKLSLQAAEIIHPYYVQLAKAAKGNFDEAVKLMTGDYKAGVKKAKEDFAYEEKYGTGQLNNALQTLGLDFTRENESTIDDLNKRGIAVYEGEGNVVQPASFNPSFDPNTFNYNVGVSGANPNMSNLGRGGVEAERLRRAQELRAEATMRAGMKPLEAAGINLKQTTNTPVGFSANDPLNKSVDFSQAGSLERRLASGYKTDKDDYLDRLLTQRSQERADITNIAGQFANTKTGAIDEQTKNQIQKQYNTDFVQSGLT